MSNLVQPQTLQNIILSMSPDVFEIPSSRDIIEDQLTTYSPCQWVFPSPNIFDMYRIQTLPYASLSSYELEEEIFLKICNERAYNEANSYTVSDSSWLKYLISRIQPEDAYLKKMLVRLLTRNKNGHFIHLSYLDGFGKDCVITTALIIQHMQMENFIAHDIHDYMTHCFDIVSNYFTLLEPYFKNGKHNWLKRACMYCDDHKHGWCELDECERHVMKITWLLADCYMYFSKTATPNIDILNWHDYRGEHDIWRLPTYRTRFSWDQTLPAIPTGGYESDGYPSELDSVKKCTQKAMRILNARRKPPTELQNKREQRKQERKYTHHIRRVHYKIERSLARDEKVLSASATGGLDRLQGIRDTIGGLWFLVKGIKGLLLGQPTHKEVIKSKWMVAGITIALNPNRGGALSFILQLMDICGLPFTVAVKLLYDQLKPCLERLKPYFCSLGTPSTQPQTEGDIASETLRSSATGDVEEVLSEQEFGILASLLNSFSNIGEGPFYASCIAAASATIASVLVGIKATRESVSTMDRIVKGAVAVAKAKTGLYAMMTIATDFMNWTYTMIESLTMDKTTHKIYRLIRDCDYPEDAGKELTKNKFAEYYKFIINPENSEYVTTSSTWRDRVAWIYNLIVHVLDQVRGSDSTDRNILISLTAIYKDIRAVQEACYKHHLKTNTRFIPFWVYIHGASQLGKSTLTKSIAEAIHKIFSRFPEYGFHASADVFAANFAVKHMTGYKQQDILFIDDVFQDQENTLGETSSTLQLINWVSNVPHFTNQASLEDKGMQFNSKMIISTSNIALPSRTKEICDQEALHQRIRLHVSATREEGYKDPSGILKDGVRLVRNFLNKQPSQPGSVLSTSGMTITHSRSYTSFEDFITDLAQAYRVHFLNQQKVMNMQLPEGMVDRISQTLSSQPTGGVVSTAAGLVFSGAQAVMAQVNFSQEMTNFILGYKFWKSTGLKRMVWREEEAAYLFMHNLDYCAKFGLQMGLISLEKGSNVVTDYRIGDPLTLQTMYGQDSYVIRILDNEHFDRKRYASVYKAFEKLSSEWEEFKRHGDVGMYEEDFHDWLEHVGTITIVSEPYQYDQTWQETLKRYVRYHLIGHVLAFLKVIVAGAVFYNVYDNYIGKCSSMGQSIGKALFTKSTTETGLKYDPGIPKRVAARSRVMRVTQATGGNSFSVDDDPQVEQLITSMNDHGSFAEISYLIPQEDRSNPDAPERYVMCCTRICGESILLPVHFFTSMEGDGVDEFAVKIPATDSEPAFIVRQKFSKNRLYEIRGKDACVYRCTKALRPCKNIVGQFIHESEEFPTQTCVTSVSRLGRKVGGANPLVGHFKSRKIALSEYEVKGRWFQVHETWDVKIRGNGKGYSGSLLLAENTRMPRKILGIQISKYDNMDMCSYAPILQQEIHDALRCLNEDLDKVVVTPFEASATIGCEISAPNQSIKPYVDKAGLWYIGSLDRKYAISSAPNTQLTRSKVWRPDCKYQPAILHKDDPRQEPDVLGKNLMFRSIEGNDIEFGSLDPEILEEVIEELADHYTHLRPLNIAREALDEDETINGIPGVLNPIDLNTSPGFPFVKQRKTKLKGKFEWFEEQDPDPNTGQKKYLMGPELRARYELRKELAIEEGRRPNDSFAYFCLKDELRPLKKIRAGKTRAFINLPMDYNILCREVFGTFTAAQHQLAGTMSSCVGIDPVRHWPLIYDKLKEKNAEWEDFDYQNWDQTLHPDLVLGYADLVSRWYKDTPMDDNWKIRRVLMEELCFTNLIAGAHLVSKNGGQCSGCAVTAEINCIIHDMLLFYSYKLFYRRKNQHRYLRDYLEECAAVIYGDDVVFSSNGEFCGAEHAKITAEIGMKITAADKEKSSNFVTKDPSKITFLKRSFVASQELRQVVCPLDPDVIERIPQWVHKSDNAFAATLVNCETALLEAFLHGSVYFNKLRDDLIERLQERDIREFSLPTYRFFKREFDAKRLYVTAMRQFDDRNNEVKFVVPADFDD